MAGYLVLARKYRSVTFDEVVGQEPIAQTLKNAIATGRIAHAYLFTGTRGVGKTTMARILAKALNCLKADAPTANPCNQCDACVAIFRGDDVDVLEIDGASNRGIDDIRELRANAIFRPSRCRFKIYYIDEVHQITKDGFNALLKTLEEPPEHVKFIFSTTEVEKVPATILSRCQRFDFRNIPTRKIAEHLRAICKAENVQADEDALFRIARCAAGSMRDGLSLLDQLIAAGAGSVSDQEVIRVLGTPSDERMISIAKAVAEGGAAAALGELNAVLESGVTLSSAVGALSDVFRNMMLAATCGAQSELIELPEAQRQAIGEMTKRFSVPALVQAVGILQSLGYKVRSSSVARALVEAALVRLAEADKFVDPASLVERLEAISTGAQGPAQKKTPRPVSETGTSELPVSSGIPSAARSQNPGTAMPQSARTEPQALAPIRWEGPWLASNWNAVIQHLAARRQMRAAGALRAGRVMSFEGDVLRLGFEPPNEVLRQQCEGPLQDTIRSALADLAGREIRCECVAVGPQAVGAAPAGTPGSGLANGESRPAARPPAALSTAEKAEIQKDPAVRAVLDLFGGDVVDVRRDRNAQVTPETEET
jgi:DNA polymerase-3 subunit gamma/tau